VATWEIFKDYFFPTCTTLSAIYIAYSLPFWKKPQKLSIVEDGIDFFVSVNNHHAEQLYKNNGMALIVSMDVESEHGAVFLSTAILIVRSKSKFRFPGIILQEKKTIKIEKDEVKSVEFIFNPEILNLPTLKDVIDFFTGSSFHIELLDYKKKKIGQTSLRRIREIRTIDVNPIVNVVSLGKKNNYFLLFL